MTLSLSLSNYQTRLLQNITSWTSKPVPTHSCNKTGVWLEAGEPGTAAAAAAAGVFRDCILAGLTAATTVLAKFSQSSIRHAHRASHAGFSTVTSTSVYNLMRLLHLRVRSARCLLSVTLCQIQALFGERYNYLFGSS